MHILLVTPLDQVCTGMVLALVVVSHASMTQGALPPPPDELSVDQDVLRVPIATEYLFF